MNNQEQKKPSQNILTFAIETSPEHFPDLFAALDLVTETVLKDARKFVESSGLPPALIPAAVEALLTQAILSLEGLRVAAQNVVPANVETSVAQKDCNCPRCRQVKAEAMAAGVMGWAPPGNHHA